MSFITSVSGATVLGNDEEEEAGQSGLTPPILRSRSLVTRIAGGVSVLLRRTSLETGSDQATPEPLRSPVDSFRDATCLGQGL